MGLWHDVCEEVCADPDVSRGYVFGNPGLKLGRKVIGCEFDGDLVVKLGAERVTELVGAGAARAFDPMGGRPMKAWAQISEPDSGDPREEWIALVEEAKGVVRAEA